MRNFWQFHPNHEPGEDGGDIMLKMKTFNFSILENCSSVVSRGSTGSNKPVNFQRRVLEPVNFWGEHISIVQFLRNFKGLSGEKNIPNPSFENPDDTINYYSKINTYD